ncbi:hypothetical protein LX36DRAFT_706898 [Colletotrichum falcatum]|nr:hypothetical protein LX36DRAFT_706898 [Colletotrichum falcatum]
MAGPEFRGDLIILPRAEACILPTTASDGPPSPSSLDIFTDASFPLTKGSRPSVPAGVAVFWKPWPGLPARDPWHSRAFQVLACRGHGQAELFAVATGLETAALLAHLMPQLRRVTVRGASEHWRRLLQTPPTRSSGAPSLHPSSSPAGASGFSLAQEVRYYNFRHLVPREQPDSPAGYEIPEEYLERARRGDWWKDDGR